MDRARIAELMDLLRRAEAPVRILRHLAWPGSVREQFLAAGGRELPLVEYPPFDASETRSLIARVRERLGRHPETPVECWLARQADSIENGALMLETAGTGEFLQHSRALYGLPGDPLPDENATALGFARRFESVLDSLSHVDLGAPPPACHLASDLAERMQQVVQQMFGDAGPEVIVVDELSANALAGPENIRIRRRACFTDRDVQQLVEHEVCVHVLTSINGRMQDALPMLASTHPATTRTQEGLAVFAEFVTGSMELDRLRRLSDRVHAIQMALDGADFLDVYRFFLERTDAPEQSFENARRVFRGGRVEGGVPFTKDIVYIDGLLRVHNFMRTVVSLGRGDLLRLLFVGKLDIEDVPALAELGAAGLCRPPVYLPPWAAGLRFLLSQLAYSSFLNTVDMDKLHAHYAEMVTSAPPCGATAA